MRHYFRSSYATETYGESYQPWDCVVLESKNFVAVPTLGAMVPGWLLVVPKEYYLCIGAMEVDRRRELVDFVKAVTNLLERTFGDIVLFEHGPSRRGSAVGCGVDYAHLHVVSTMCDIMDQVARLAPWIEWVEVEGFESAAEVFETGSEYLFVQQSCSGGAHIGLGDEIPSQLLRKAIANYLGRPDKFDWKTYPELENVLTTLAMLKDNELLTELEIKA